MGSLGRDEEMELNDECFERTLAEEDEELGRRRSEVRRRVPEDAEGEDGDDADVRVVRVVDELGRPRELKRPTRISSVVAGEGKASKASAPRTQSIQSWKWPKPRLSTAAMWATRASP